MSTVKVVNFKVSSSEELLKQYLELITRHAREYCERKIGSIGNISLTIKVQKYLKKHSVTITFDKIDKLIINIYYQNKKLKQVGSYDFELIVKRLIEDIGYDVLHTKKTRDGGYDLEAKILRPIPACFLIECKSSMKSRTIGISTVRQLLDCVNEKKVSGGILATNSIFSKDVIKRALQQSYRLILWDFNKIITMIDNYIGSLASKYFRVAIA